MAVTTVAPESTPEPSPHELEKVRNEFAKLIEEAEQQWRQQYAKTPTKPPKIVYCMSFYEERMPQVKQCIERVRPYVDRCVLVYDDSVSEESKKWLKQRGCELYYRKWDNHFSKQRNAYLEQVEEGSFILVSDPDELFCTEFLKEMHKICEEADKQGINMIGINSHDILIKINGQREEKVSDFWKNLLFKFEEGVRYVGVVHETLLPGVSGWRVANLDRRFYYEHIKEEHEVWERATRNFHIAGGGNNLKEKNPVWIEYQNLIKSLEIPQDWPAMREYLRKGNVHPQLKSFLIKHRNRNVIPDADTEIREYFKWYFEYLHPQENTEGWKSEPEEPPYGSWAEIRNYVEDCYMKILGRHADEPGKNHYTQAILEGKIKREDLPKILKASPEYQMKHPIQEEVTVGAIVLAKNEEKNIEACLKHLKPYVDFLAVFIDSATNDKTIEIAKQIADAIVVRHFSGSFAEERNRAQAMMPTNWVLHVDADERFPEDFLQNIKKIIKDGQALSFRFPRLNPRKRDYPDYQVRLLRKDATEWKRHFHEIPYSKQHNKPIDQVSVKTLDKYPITHLGEKRDWAKILGDSKL